MVGALRLASLLVLGLPTPVLCTDRPTALGADVGFGPDANRLGAHVENLLYERDRPRGGRWTVSIEAGLSRWTTPDEGRKSVWQLSGVPFVRIWGSRLYGEVGIGASLFSDISIGGQQLGSNFQFCDHIGAGYEWPGGRRIGIRISHFSNGRIAKPNDGLDLVQVIYTQAL
jgi:Lipid A 3-O-deacylase (PagL).